jgi:hypothetical protein
MNIIKGNKTALEIELNYNQNFSSHINQSEIILDMTKCKFEVTMYTG